VIAHRVPAIGDERVSERRALTREVVAPESPEWLLGVTREVTRRHGLDVLVSRSGLDADQA
jgi:hypothetical protein